ncbi:MAG: site-specific DNA-methyltransferase, partial [Candidatus Hydrogenedentes bacterium]|nr:site-specific DNA-methyltransferase [Candidatus Hydrogenedentota bacterium]
MAKKKAGTPKQIETLTHAEAKRKNIPSAEHQSVMREEDKSPIQVAYERRNKDLDPQLVWRGKDMQDWSDLVVQAGPLYVQERVHPKVLIDDLQRIATDHKSQATGHQTDLFADFNGIPEGVDKTEFYQHEANWSNRMILGDSLQVMASLAEREGLRGKVQCIYFDPPYGIKFNSNFQWSTTSRDVKDGKADHITREPEQVKAFRDTWRDGIHSYLTYLRDRLTVARDLLTDSGSIFVQIGDENVHRVRAVMDEVFGDDNFVSSIGVTKTTSATSMFLAGVVDHLLWYSRNRDFQKYRALFALKGEETKGYDFSVDDAGIVHRSATAARRASLDNLTSQSGGETTRMTVDFEGSTFRPTSGGWKTSPAGMQHLKKARRLGIKGQTLRYVRCFEDFPVNPRNNTWSDISTGGFVSTEKTYVVQTNEEIVKRCILMSTDPG